jgi:hypothetical protein
MRAKIALVVFATIFGSPLGTAGDINLRAGPEKALKEFQGRYETAFMAMCVAKEGRDRDSKTHEIQDLVWQIGQIDDPAVLRRLVRLLASESRDVRNVAAMGLGNQQHDPESAGRALMRAWQEERHDQSHLVGCSILDALEGLKFTGYWPVIQKAVEARPEVPMALVYRAVRLVTTKKDSRAVSAVEAVVRKTPSPDR